jgi:hypothetical protein
VIFLGGGNDDIPQTIVRFDWATYSGETRYPNYCRTGFGNFPDNAHGPFFSRPISLEPFVL